MTIWILNSVSKNNDFAFRSSRRIPTRVEGPGNSAILLLGNIPKDHEGGGAGDKH